MSETEPHVQSNSEETDESATQADAGDRPLQTTAGESVEELQDEWRDYRFDGRTKLAVEDLDVYYGDDHALKSVSMDIPEESVTALIGPSGCGKSTFLRCLNRMNDRIKAARIDGSVKLDGEEIYQDNVDLVELRKRVGMVFQAPNPFPKSIRDNIAYGPRKHGDLETGLLARLLGRDDTEAETELVEQSLRQAALWDEVSDRLDDNALGLSGGQQQRLCIARCLAVGPEVILMDEPASALDPIATACSRRRASPTRPPSSSPAANWSSTTTRTRSSRTPRASASRTTSRASSGSVPRDSFRAELEAIRESIADLGWTVLAAFEQAVEALAEGHEAAARQVIAGDEAINDRYLSLESRCIDLFALQQPVAGDLRFVAASFKILTDIERIGDLATNLADQALRKERSYLPDLNVRDLADIAAEMFDRAITAYENGDPELCHAVADQDDELDGLCERVAGLVLEDLVGRDAGDAVDRSLLAGVRRLLLTIRDIERVGDHAVNVAARSLYMTDGTEALLY